MPEPEPSISNVNVNAATMPLGARLGNVFVSPTEVFDEVKVSPHRALNWILPTVLSIIFGIVFVLVAFSQPAIVQRIKEAQEAKLNEMVKSGKIPQEIADKQENFLGPGILKIGGVVGVIFVQPIMLFLSALIVWLIGRFSFHGPVGYIKSVEVVGLASMIAIPGAIIRTLLTVIYGNMAMSPGPILLVSHFEATNRLHALLAALDVFSLWYVAVVAIGLSRLSGASFLKSALWGYGFFAILLALRVVFSGGK